MRKTGNKLDFAAGASHAPSPIAPAAGSFSARIIFNQFFPFSFPDPFSHRTLPRRALSLPSQRTDE
jgi:hypothetical protein